MNLRKILEELMAGNFICTVVNEPMFRFLSSVDGVNQVNDALSPWSRKLTQLPDDGAFYLITTDINHKLDKQGIRKHFEECRDSVEPVVSFLVLLSRVLPESGILTSGSTVRFAEVLTTVASNEHHIKQLNQLMTLKLFRTGKNGTDEKLKALFKGMIDVGLLVERNTDEMIFQVTGKLDYIHHVMQFIADHENIDISEGTDDQAELAI